MGWNGSERENAKKGGEGGQGRDRRSSVRPTPSPSPVSNCKALVAGLIVVIGGGLAAYFFTRGEGGESGGRVEAKPSRIAEVKPQIVTNAAEGKCAEEPALTKEQKMLKMLHDRYGDNIPDSLKTTVYYLNNPPKKTFPTSPQKFGYLKHKGERVIAEMLTTEPGTLLVRQPKFDERFDSEFMAAATEKVEIKVDDPDDVREIKKAVQETKDELASRVKAGERASDILNAEGKSLYDLGMYKHELQQHIADVSHDPNATDDDIRAVVSAANKMLEERGAASFRLPGLAMRRASLAVSAERRRQTESESKSGKTQKGE